MEPVERTVEDGWRPIELGAGFVIRWAGAEFLRGAGAMLLGAGAVILCAGATLLGAGAARLGAGAELLGAGLAELRLLDARPELWIRGLVGADRAERETLGLRLEVALGALLRPTERDDDRDTLELRGLDILRDDRLDMLREGLLRETERAGRDDRAAGRPEDLEALPTRAPLDLDRDWATPSCAQMSVDATARSTTKKGFGVLLSI